MAILSLGSYKVTGAVAVDFSGLVTGTLDCPVDFQSLSAKALGDYGRIRKVSSEFQVPPTQKDWKLSIRVLKWSPMHGITKFLPPCLFLTFSKCARAIT